MISNATLLDISRKRKCGQYEENQTERLQRKKYKI